MGDNNFVEKNITIKGRTDQVEVFVEMLKHIEFLENIGASRNLLIRVDGDGCANIHFYDEKNKIIKHENLTDEEKDNLAAQDKMHSCCGVYDFPKY